MIQNGWISRRTRGVYELEEDGLDTLLESIPTLTLDLVLAFRVIEGDLTALGIREILALRLVDGSVATFLIGGAVSTDDEELGLDLKLRERWSDPEEIREELSRIRPEAGEAPEDLPAWMTPEDVEELERVREQREQEQDQDDG